jgi:ribosomal protein S18 acetylase RimI-like enzyme
MIDAQGPALSWRDLRSEDIEALVSLHADSLPGSSLSMAGPRTIRSFYRFASDSRRELVLLCRSATGGTILGGAVMSVDPGSIKRRMLGSALPFSMLLDRLMQRSDVKPPEVMAPPQGIRVEVLGHLSPGSMHRPQAPEVLHIFAHGSLRGAGIGRALMTTCETEAALAGYVALFVRTRSDADNPALRFYRALGYSEVETRSEGGKRLTLFHRSLAAASDDPTGR